MAVSNARLFKLKQKSFYKSFYRQQYWKDEIKLLSCTENPFLVINHTWNQFFYWDSGTKFSFILQLQGFVVEKLKPSCALIN